MVIIIYNITIAMHQLCSRSDYCEGATRVSPIGDVQQWTQHAQLDSMSYGHDHPTSEDCKPGTVEPELDTLR